MTFKYRDSNPRRHRVDLPAGLTTRDALFTALAERVPFPAYFGRNWDALQDCLCDLSEVTADIVELVHADVPALPPDELAIYVDVLATAVDECEASGAGPELEVVFPRAARERITELLDGDDGP